MPSYVYLPKRLGHFAGYDINGQYAGWLGRAYDPLSTDIRKRAADDNPFFRDCTDDELDFRLSGLEPLPELRLDRFQRREGLLAQFDAQRRQLDRTQAAQELGTLRRQALDLLTSPEIASAFDIRIRLGWLQLWCPMVCPSAAIRLTRSGSPEADLPIKNNVARTHSCASAASTLSATSRAPSRPPTS